MAWFVEITGVVGDAGLVRTVIESQGYQLIEQPDNGSARTVLHHPRFEELHDASAIRADARRLSDNLSRFGKANDLAIGLTIGPVQQVKADGQITKHIVVQGSARISIEARATLTLVRDPSISDEERRREEAEVEARAIAHRRELAIRRAKAALNDPRLLDVMELLRVENPSPTQLGHIVDLVKDAVGGKLEAFGSGKEFQRFERSINHPKAMGLEARHAVSKVDPPPRPMSLEEARVFALRIGAAWLATFDQK